jgi:penicillin-binding protein-related factor A (putative recombinase)
MASTPEKKVKEKIKQILKARGAVYCMPMGTGYGSAGVSDFIVCYKGYFIAIEAKAGKGTTTALQDKWLAEVSEAGGISLVINEGNINSVNVALNVVDRILLDTPL